jgi:hypothetical protein
MGFPRLTEDCRLFRNPAFCAVVTRAEQIHFHLKIQRIASKKFFRNVNATVRRLYSARFPDTPSTGNGELTEESGWFTPVGLFC